MTDYDKIITEATEYLQSGQYVSGAHGLLDQAVEALMELKAERDALAARIEAVRSRVSEPCTSGCCAHCDGKNEGWEMVLDILSAVPTDALRAHDDALIEKCAGIAESLDFGPGATGSIHRWASKQAAKRIREQISKEPTDE